MIEESHKILLSAIEQFRVDEGRPWAPSAWPASYALAVPSLEVRNPCNTCCATIDFGISNKGAVALSDILAQNGNDFPKAQNNCCEVMTTIMAARLQAEQGR